MDAGVRWQLARLPVETPALGSWAPADPREFWAASRVHIPPRSRPAWCCVTTRRGGGAQPERPSQGPGTDPGAGGCRPPRTSGLAGGTCPSCWSSPRAWPRPQSLVRGASLPALTAKGAIPPGSTFPFTFAGARPAAGAVEGFIQADLTWTREIVRQSVEDCAAVLAWARREVSDRVEVCGTSLGGLVAVLLAAQLELDGVVAIAPFCDPASTVLHNLPRRTRRAVGLDGGGEASGGSTVTRRDGWSRRHSLPSWPAPFVRRPRPGADRHRPPTLDGIVGDAPMAELAAAWGRSCELPAGGMSRCSTLPVWPPG